MHSHSINTLFVYLYIYYGQNSKRFINIFSLFVKLNKKQHEYTAIPFSFSRWSNETLFIVFTSLLLAALFKKKKKADIYTNS